MKKNFLPPTYLVLSIGAMVVTFFLLPGMRLFSIPWNLAGLVPLGAGVAIELIADEAFKKLGTTVKPYERPKVIVTDGLFSFSRHPMYLGMVLMLLGIAILMGVLTPFFVAALFALIMDRLFVVAEERMMEEVFGDAWRRYKKSVRRWL